VKIGFEHQIFALQNYGGVSRYFVELVRELNRMKGTEAKIIAPMHLNHYAAKLSHRSFQGVRIPAVPWLAPRMCMAVNRLVASSLMSRFSPDVVHSTYYHPFKRLPGSAAHVLTVYDMTHERLPAMFGDGDPTPAQKRKAVHAVDHVICISENTRRDLIDCTGVDAGKVSVVHIGYNVLAPGQRLLVASPEKDAKPFLLYVGGRKGYKNFSMLLRAYASSPWLRTDFRILAFGGGSFSSEEQELISSLGLVSPQVEQMGGGDGILSRQYAEAAALVYPSLYEGFGLPPLEAMSAGCPVICSNTSSIPEVVGNAGEYFNPSDVDSVRMAIERVLQSSERREELVRAGLLKCAEYSWARCAEETFAVYRKLVP
jgi:glycosyltransferase involved in cell wall biosynthesis